MDHMGSKRWRIVGLLHPPRNASRPAPGAKERELGCVGVYRDI